MFTQHHQLKQNRKWDKYDHLSDEEKTKFFDVEVPFGWKMSSSFEVDKKRVYCFHSLLIDNVVKKHFKPDDTEYWYRNFIKNMLQRVSEEMYNFTIPSSSRIHIIVRFFRNGKSFLQALQSVCAVRDVGGRANFSEVTESTVRQSAQAIIAVSFHGFQNLVCDSRCCAFSIVFDAASSQKEPYWDVIFRAVFQNYVSNVRFLATSLHDSHKELLIFKVVSQVFEVVFEICWKYKLVSVTTDEASSMDGRVRGARIRFQQVFLSAFFCIWCANHQLDLVIKSVMKYFMENSFWSKLVLFISYLTRLNTLRSPMEWTCAIVCRTRWFFLGPSTTWLTRHREEIQS